MASRALTKQIDEDGAKAGWRRPGPGEDVGGCVNSTPPLLPGPGADQFEPVLSNISRRSQVTFRRAGGRAKSRKSCTVCSSRRTSPWMTRKVVLGERPGLLLAQARLDQHLDRGQRVADLVGDAGRQLADGGELLAPQHLALLRLQSLRHLGDPLTRRARAGGPAGPGRRRR